MNFYTQKSFKEGDLKMADKKVTGWFTMNGKHIPVFEGESKKDAVKRSISNGKAHQPVSKGHTEKKWKEFEDASRKAEIMHADIDAPKYRKKEIDKAREYDKAVEQKRKNGEIKSVKIKKKSIDEKPMGKFEKEIRDELGHPTGKLTKGMKSYIQIKEEERRRKEGIKTKYGAKDTSKLSQHKEIQRMADDHIEKIYTREGGVKNQELVDEADKFAKANNLNVTKVRDAAMKAMNEKYVEAWKLKEAGKDPLSGVKSRREQKSSVASKNEDIKAKQIAQAKEQADIASGKKSVKIVKMDKKSSLKDKHFQSIAGAKNETELNHAIEKLSEAYDAGAIGYDDYMQLRRLSGKTRKELSGQFTKEKEAQLMGGYTPVKAPKDMDWVAKDVADSLKKRIKSRGENYNLTDDDIVEIFTGMNDDYDDWWSRSVNTKEKEKAFLDDMKARLKKQGITVGKKSNK